VITTLRDVRLTVTPMSLKRQLKNALRWKSASMNLSNKTPPPPPPQADNKTRTHTNFHYATLLGRTGRAFRARRQCAVVRTGQQTLKADGGAVEPVYTQLDVLPLHCLEQQHILVETPKSERRQSFQHLRELFLVLVVAGPLEQVRVAVGASCKVLAKPEGVGEARLAGPPL
jgi:hypothetical protein